MPAGAVNLKWTEHGEQFGGCGALDRINIQYTNDPLWTTALKFNASASQSLWSADIEKNTGGSLLRRDQGQTFTATWSNGPSGNADTQCAGTWLSNIRMNVSLHNDYESNIGFFKDVFTHEVGHAYGLGHVGREDNGYAFNPQLPIMTTCLPVGNTSRKVSADDEAAARAQFSMHDSGQGFRGVTANSSFEEGELTGKEYWTTNVQSGRFGRSDNPNGSSAGQPGGYIGSWHAYLNDPAGTSADGHLGQEVLITADAGMEARGSAHYRRFADTYGGTVGVYIGERMAKHDNGNCNLLDTVFLSELFWRKSFCGVDGAWRVCRTSVANFGGRTGDDNVAYSRLLIYNFTFDTVSGVDTPVRLDLAQVEGKIQLL